MTILNKHKHSLSDCLISALFCYVKKKIHNDNKSKQAERKPNKQTKNPNKPKQTY